MPKKFLTVKEVSRLLGVSALTVRNWDQKGKLAAYRHPMNNYRMYKIEDVEVLLKGFEGSRKQFPVKRAEPVKEVAKPRKLKIEVL
jgi:DNA (cytosine-5)-methyltransferase 1